MFLKNWIKKNRAEDYENILINNENIKQKYPGTTALILRALCAQIKAETALNVKNENRNEIKAYIENSGEWLLKNSNEWKYPATTSLVLRGLNLIYPKKDLICHFIDLIKRQEKNGCFDNLNTTVLILIAFYEFFEIK